MGATNHSTRPCSSNYLIYRNDFEPCKTDYKCSKINGKPCHIIPLVLRHHNNESSSNTKLPRIGFPTYASLVDSSKLVYTKYSWRARHSTRSCAESWPARRWSTGLKPARQRGEQCIQTPE